MARPDSRKALKLKDYVAGVRSGDRAVLARAITLIESRKAEHRKLAQELLQALLPDTGAAHRIGITGVPGVGKSTLIDQLGSTLTAAGHKVAVLAVDPTSSRSGGSILGDKTRMGRLAQDANAYIRPSPTAGTLGGVTRTTRETMALMEAAGFDVVLVETVGVGQSEAAVAGMVDVFVALMLPGAGDELQGIKRGVVELADIIAVTKADGDNTARAQRAAAELQAALHILTPESPSWTPPVLTLSAKENRGLDALWAQIEAHRERLMATGEFEARRRGQAVAWMHEMLEARLITALKSNAKVAKRLPALERAVRDGKLTPALAVEEIATLMRLGPSATRAKSR
jgi:LAO/AO transport system kinase